MTLEPLWQVIGQSVRGASHFRADLPNQDAITWRPTSQSGPPLILVVSDGHGSAKSFRSDRGSKFAVVATADLLQELTSGQSDPHSLSMVKRVAEQRLPEELVRRWRRAVDEDLSEHPFTEEELSKLARQRGQKSRDEVSRAPRLAYGATVLGVLVAQDYLLFLQLGDGDILSVAADGTVTRPFVRDSRLIANETTSLCMSDAWREVRLRFQANYGGLPALIMAATDGYANSFVNDDAFRQVGSDILAILREDGVETVAENLPDWLGEASAAGSGDDISLGILYRVDAIGADCASAVSSDETRASTSTKPCPSIGMDPVVLEASEATPRDPARLAGDRASHRDAGGATAPEGAGGSRDRGFEDPEIRSRFVRRIKHEGPSEPSKHARLTDAVGDDGGKSDAAASTDTTPHD